MTTGVVAPASDARRAVAREVPSSSGMCMSTMARSNRRPPDTQPSASRGEPVALKVIPQRSSSLVTIRRFVALSSTTRTWRPLRSTPTIGDGASGEPVASASIVSRNVLPWPATPVLSATSDPCMSSARRRLIARPRPVPPYRREIEASAWLNDWNSRAIRSGGMPMPGVADIDDEGPSVAARARGRQAVARDGQFDLARFGELDGVGQQVDDDLPEAALVADDRARQAVVDAVGELEMLRGRERRDDVEGAFDARREVERRDARARPCPLRSSRSPGCR